MCLRGFKPHTFLNPVGHLGEIAVTFFIAFPFEHVMVFFIDLGEGVAEGEAIEDACVGVGVAVVNRCLSVRETYSSASLIKSINLYAAEIEANAPPGVHPASLVQLGTPHPVDWAPM